MRLTVSFNDKNRRQILLASILTLIVVSGLFTYIVSLFAFISPTQELRWDASITTINKQTFNRGETVTISGLLEEGTEYIENGSYYFFTSSENIVWIINVLDPNNLPIHLAYTAVPNAWGDIDTGNINFNLPADAATGTYTIRIMVWTDWLPDGETRTYLINEMEFTVIP